jgi:cell division protein FtsZ
MNVDFADVKSVMLASGSAIMGIGKCSGEGRALEAAKAAISSDLLETSIQGASGLIVNITGGPDMTLLELNDAIDYIYDSVLDDAKVIIGTTIDEDIKDAISITVIATGAELKPQPATVSHGYAKETTAPSIENIFSGLNTGLNSNVNSNNVGTQTSMPQMPNMSFTNIEIPDFLKK